MICLCVCEAGNTNQLSVKREVGGSEEGVRAVLCCVLRKKKKDSPELRNATPTLAIRSGLAHRSHRHTPAALTHGLALRKNSWIFGC